MVHAKLLHSGCVTREVQRRSRSTAGKTSGVREGVLPNFASPAGPEFGFRVTTDPWYVSSARRWYSRTINLVEREIYLDPSATPYALWPLSMRLVMVLAPAAISATPVTPVLWLSTPAYNVPLAATVMKFICVPSE